MAVCGRQTNCNNYPVVNLPLETKYYKPKWYYRYHGQALTGKKEWLKPLERKPTYAQGFLYF